MKFKATTRPAFMSLTFFLLTLGPLLSCGSPEATREPQSSLDSTKQIGKPTEGNLELMVGSNSETLTSSEPLPEGILLPDPILSTEPLPTQPSSPVDPEQIPIANPDEGSSSGEPLPGGEPLPDSDHGDADMALCEKAFAAPLERIQISASHNKRTIDALAPLYLRITGNQNQAGVRIPSGKNMPGLCVFLAGNQPRLDLLVNGTLENLVIISRGNQAQAKVTVAQGAEIKLLSVDLKGNKPKVSILGEGAHPCPSSSKEAVSCQ